MIRTLTLSSGTTRDVHLHGWKKQANDPRDANFSVKLHRALLGPVIAQVTKMDNRGICSPVEDQADLGSCTANALAGIVEANERRGTSKSVLPDALSAVAAPQVLVSGVAQASDGSISYTTKVVPVASQPAPAPTPPAPKKFIDASRMFQYYATRKIEGTITEDSGATIRDTIKAAALYGVVDETLWPYVPNKFAVNPPQAVWSAAAAHKVTSYHAIADGDIESMKAVLTTQYLIEFGFQVYDFMLSQQMAKTGMLCRPLKTESLQGGHAVDLVGFDDNMAMPDGSKGAFLVRNSWGPSWGIGGYFWMAYNYVSDPTLSSDFWVVQSSPLG